MHKKEHTRSTFECDQCDESFPLSINLGLHKRIHTEVKLIAVNQSDKSASQLADHKKIKKECNQCHKSFNKLKNHIRLAQDKIYTCKKCELTFNNCKLFRLHIKEHAKPSFGCKKCRFTTSHEGHLTKHNSARHSDEKYKCNKCTFKTNQPTEFNEHKEKRHKIYCEHCNKEFTTNSGLRKHIESIHEEITSKCTKCSYVGYDVAGHMRKQHGPPKYVCDECGLKTSFKANFIYHKLSKHSKNEEYLKENKASLFKGIGNTCDQCNYSTKWLNNMYRHKLRRHTVDGKNMDNKLTFLSSQPSTQDTKSFEL
jgi:KRAB domain-containing zinc finger protein